MEQQWIYNPIRGRYELWGRNPATGQVGVIQIAAFPGTTHPDVPQGTPVTPLSQDDYALIQRAQAGDAAALSTISQGLAQRTAEANGRAPSGQGQSGDQGQGYGGVRQTPEQVNAYTNIVDKATDIRSAQNALQQKEYELRQKMAQSGQDPAYWFGQVSSPTGGAAGAGGESTTMPGVALDPAYINAYTGQNTAAARAALLGQAERLQQVANLYGAHMEGADWLEKFGNVNRALQNAGADLAWNEHLADADPRQDKNLVPVRTGGFAHGSNAGVAGQLADARHQRDQMLAQRNPGQYMWEQQQRMARAATQPYQNWVAPVQTVTAAQASGHVPWNPLAMSGYIPHEEEYQTYAQGGQMPRYEDGGWAEPAQTTSGPSQQTKDTDFQTYQLEQWYQAQVQQAQQDAANQMGQIQQSAQFQIGQLDKHYSQQMQALQAQVPLIQQELARRSQGVSQQAANVQRVGNLRPFAAQGGPQAYAG